MRATDTCPKGQYRRADGGLRYAIVARSRRDATRGAKGSESRPMPTRSP